MGSRWRLGLLCGALLAGAAWGQQGLAPVEGPPAAGPRAEADAAASPAAAQAGREAPAGEADKEAADKGQEAAGEAAEGTEAEGGEAEGEAAAPPSPPPPRSLIDVSALADALPQLVAAWSPVSRPVTPLPVASLLPPEESPLLPPAPRAAPNVWSTRAYRLLPDKPLAAVKIYAPRPRPAFRGEAFTDPRSCAVDPFASLSTDERQQQLRRDCGRDQIRFGVDGSRVQPALPQQWQPATPGVLPVQSAPTRLEFDQVQTERWSPLDTPLVTSVRFGWQGTREGHLGQVQSDQRALLATGGLLRLGPDAALDMSIGRQRSGSFRSADLRTRATVTGLWRPLGDHMVYAQWSDEAVAGPSGEVGMRWWLRPGSVSLDLGARRSAEGQALEPRLTLSMGGFLR